MALASGAHLGSYEIVGPLGAGGMGEVYRARDTKPNRSVAIKILPDLFAHDLERVERFTREAQVLAALNHPNVAQIYGLIEEPEEASHLHALAMELVDGEDLSATIARGPLPIAEALPIARQIADALEAAHEHGIIHRDLKPANIKVRADGTVKVLDFGLAKAMDPSGRSGVGSVADSPTLTARATQIGMILGTAAYMAPEQARGKAVDKRADIWAFGAILYEMLSGCRAFDGEDVSETLASVIKEEVAWEALPASTPPPMRRLVERCLAKEPRARLRDIGEARHTIEEVISGRTEPASAPPAAGPAVSAQDAAPSAAPHRRPIAWLPWIVAAACALAAAAAWLRPPGRPTSAGPLTRVEVSLPEDVTFYASPRISPDGRRIAFVGVQDGVRKLFLRELSQAQTKAVERTDGAIAVAFAPDSVTAAFVTTDGSLKRVGLLSGSVETLAAGVDVTGGVTWSTDNRLYVGQVTRLLWMPAAGGTPKEIAAVATGAAESGFLNPVPTPDGRHVLFTSTSGTLGAMRQRVEVVPVEGGERRVLVEDAGFVVAVFPDRFLFQRGTTIEAMPFDAARAIATGPAVQLTAEAASNPTGGIAADVSTSGDLFFAENTAFSGQLVWVSKSGTERLLQLPARSYTNPRVSPNGRAIAYSDHTAIWTVDAERGAQTRIYVGNDGVSGFPTWSADSSVLFFRSASGVVRMRADGEGKPELVPGTTRQDYPNSISPDGKTLGMTRILPTSSGDVVLLPLEGGEGRVAVGTSAYEGGAQVSPNGKWLAYVSSASGRMEVYLRPMEGSDRYAVSTAGGMHPLWSRDGSQIYFRNGQKMLAVDVTTSPTVHLGAPRILFERRYSFGPNITIANYSLSSDGREFLMVRENSGSGRLSLIFNWLPNAGR